jgi:diadenosine tetraphosphatase ApaH/serine/threonine PP2A family protein phosphatase
VPTAVVSDIHGNAVALKAVLEDIASIGVDRIICLGDIIGYGPDPLECVDLVREKCAWALMGNHDFGVLYEPTNFNPAAESAAFWTRAQFDNEPDETLRAQRYDFLGRLRVRVIEHMPDPDANAEGGTATNGDLPGVLCVHASPRRPINEYIFPDDAKDAPDKMQAIFDRVERIAMVGHTHVPGVFTEDLDFFPPTELGDPAKYSFSPDEKIVINVGSVGQPRDHDPRAAYAVLHNDRVEFRRVPYDIEATASRIKAIAELHDWLGDRLFDGR